MTQDVLMLRNIGGIPAIIQSAIFWQIQGNRRHDVRREGIVKIHTRLMWERPL